MNKEQVHIRMAIDLHFKVTGIGADIVSEAAKEGLIIQQDDSVHTWRDEFMGFDAPHNYRALITAELCLPFFEAIGSVRDKAMVFPTLILKWLTYFGTLFEKEGRSMEEFLEKGLGLYPLTVYFFKDDEKFSFTFPHQGRTNQIASAWLQLIDIVEKVRAKNQHTITWLQSVPRQKNNMCFLVFEPGSDVWQLMDRLVDASLRLSTAYRAAINDDRVRKPYIVFNEENYNQFNYFDNQWTLELDKEGIIMPQPNDIALYVRMADKSVIQAEKFYKEEHKRRSGKLHMPLLSNKDYLKYYDYFEAIIAALTFSYTSIETLANICIPHEYEYVEEGKGKRAGIRTTYTKEAIERNFPLRDKLKLVLLQVLKTSDPTKERWWNDFIDLEEIRNEVIHSKQSKSEERYSFFLSKRIFAVIRCNKVIIRFYGHYIQKELPHLLFDFPYGFEYDSVPASFMSNDDYVAHYNSLHSPWLPGDDQ